MSTHPTSKTTHYDSRTGLHGLALNVTELLLFKTIIVIRTYSVTKLILLTTYQEIIAEDRQLVLQSLDMFDFKIGTFCFF